MKSSTTEHMNTTSGQNFTSASLSIMEIFSDL